MRNDHHPNKPLATQSTEAGSLAGETSTHIVADPFPTESLSPAAFDPLETRKRLEECILAFERDSKQGTARPLCDYLPAAGQFARRAALVELIKVDLELLTNRGECIDLEAYCERYPELGTVGELPVDLVYEYYLTARQRDESVQVEHFRSRFPRQFPALAAMVQREYTASTSLARIKPTHMPSIGQTIADFELLKLLGEGSFGKVFLARQISLDRQVALKMSANRGTEAKTLAALEHDHIVRIFSETVQAGLNLRLLCMQYVPGTSLDRVIRSIGLQPEASGYGSRLLQAVDAQSSGPAAFHPSALRAREVLEQAGLVETVCWIGIHLAEALSTAHSRGILHRDIKPANVLIDHYGRPFLADFNLSFDPHHLAGTTAGMFGGSLGYMSPEHLDAFNPNDETGPHAVDHRSDVYSLAVVLLEMTIGRIPWDHPPQAEGTGDLLRDMADQRRREPPTLGSHRGDLLRPLNQVLRRSVHPVPERRYQSAGEFVNALEGVREIYQIEHEMPALGNQLARLLGRPFLMFLLLMLLPHLLGTLVNIAYNAMQIVSALDAAQKAAFTSLVLGYNALVYPIALGITYWLVAPVYQAWNGLHSRGETAGERITQARRRMLSWPAWVIGLSCVGWLPGGVLFPLGIDWLAGPIPSAVLGHFVISFTISGLIALTYSYFVVQFFVVRVLYGQLWSEPHRVRLTARAELKATSRWVRRFQVLAGAIPLAGAVLVIAVAPSEMTSGFRFLTTALISAGLAGFGFAVAVANHLLQTLHVLTGGPDSR